MFGSSYPAIARFVSHNGSGFWDLQYNNNDNSFSFDKNDSEKKIYLKKVEGF